MDKDLKNLVDSWYDDNQPLEEEPQTDATETEIPEPDNDTEPEETDLPEETKEPENEDTEASEDDPSVLQEGEEQPQDEPTEPASPEQPKPQPIVLKHNGQDIPISDMATVIALAQKGLDYGQKTQEIKPLRELAAHLQEHPEDWAKVKSAIEKKQQGQQKEGPTTPKPEWSEGETQEEYVARVAQWQANEVIAERERREQARDAEAQTLFKGISQDPLSRDTLALIAQDAQAGRIPGDQLSAANSDPRALRQMYSYYRRAAEAIAIRRPTQPPQSPPQQQTPAITPRKKVTVPQTEKSRKFLTQRRALTAKTIEDLSSEEFQQLSDRIKRGEKVKIE